MSQMDTEKIECNNIIVNFNLGQYFTPRHIVDYMYQKLNLEINNNDMNNSIIDSFAGSSGFTSEHIYTVNKNI